MRDLSLPDDGGHEATAGGPAARTLQAVSAVAGLVGAGMLRYLEGKRHHTH